MAGALAVATGGSMSCGLTPAFDSFLFWAKVPTTAITANDAMIHVRFISSSLRGNFGMRRDRTTPEAKSKAARGVRPCRIVKRQCIAEKHRVQAPSRVFFLKEIGRAACR